MDLPDEIVYTCIVIRCSFHGLWFSHLEGNDWCLIRVMQSSRAEQTFGDTHSNLGASAPQVSWPSSQSQRGHGWHPPPPITGSDTGNFVVKPKVYLIVHCSLSEKVRARKRGGGRRKRRKMGWNGEEERKKDDSKIFKGPIPPTPLWTN